MYYHYFFLEIDSSESDDDYFNTKTEEQYTSNYSNKHEKNALSKYQRNISSNSYSKPNRKNRNLSRKLICKLDI